MVELNWPPLWHHSFFALVIVLALLLIGLDPWLICSLNALGWFLRELYQAFGLKRISRRRRERNPLKWPFQKHLEWIFPAVFGAAVAIGVLIWRSSS